MARHHNHVDSTPVLPTGLHVTHTQDVKQRVAVEDLLMGCAMAGQESEAITWLQQLPPQQQDSFIQRCLEAGQLRTAVLAVRGLEAHDRFPEAEGRYYRHKLRRLLDKGVWSAAVELAGTDADAQVCVHRPHTPQRTRLNTHASTPVIMLSVFALLFYFLQGR